MEQLLKLNKKLGDMTKLNTSNKETLAGAINEVVSSKKLIFKRGLKKDLPINAPLGEPLYCIDTNELYIGKGDTLAIEKIVDKELVDKFNSLIINAGNSNAEIVSARTNKEFTFATVGDRLNNVDLNIDSKVEKIQGKGLSSNDFTNEDKKKMLSVDPYVSKVEKIELELNKNTKEINDAKNGNSSLKKELNDRFNLVNDNMKVHWLEQSGKSIKVSNSLNGATRDLKIEGNTLQNIGKFSKKYVLNKNTTLISAMPLSFITPPNKLFYLYFKYKNNLSINKNVMIRGYKGDTTSFTQYNTLDFKANTSEIVEVELKDNIEFGIYSILIGIRDFTEEGTIIIEDIIISANKIDLNTAYFEGIKSVGETEENKVNIISHGKNLINIDKIKFLDFDKDRKLPNQPLQNGMRIYRFSNGYHPMVVNITLEKNKTYIVSGIANKSLHNLPLHLMIYKDGISIFNKIYTTPFTCSETGVYCVGFEMSGKLDKPSEAYTDFINIQLEEVEKTTYEPYKGDSSSISLPFEHGLKGLPNGVKDEIIGNKIIQRIGIIDFSKIDFSVYEYNYPTYSGRNEHCCVISKPELPKSYSGSSDPLICNNFLNRGLSEMNNLGGKCVTSYTDGSYTQNKLYFCCNNTTLGITSSMSISERNLKMKEYLINSRTVVYYDLKQSVEHEIEATELATYKDITYIKSLNTIEGTNSCKIATDRDAITQNLINNKNILEKENKIFKSNIITITDILLAILNPVINEKENKELLEHLIKIKNIVK